MRAMDSPRPAWLARLARAGTGLADALFPPQCLGCGAETGAAGALCTPCWEATDFIDAAACRRCGIPLEAGFAGDTECAACLARPPAFARARAVFRYDTARDLVLRFKHGDRTDYAPAFAAWMARAGADLLAAADLVVPVPLHRWRLLARRYNQAAVLANALARRTGKRVLADALTRTRPTPSQGAMVSARARRRNVQGAFAVRRGAAWALGGKSVLLVDDVMTTGATLEAAARALLRAGAREVSALTLARVVRPEEAPILA
ncbi:MAG: ComF family protein [Alphaproteobacteria bacterium]|nr:ComF family protein [Alphaproteobacteria bacterium]